MYVVGSLFAPVIFSVRFAILAPLGWLIPPVGRFVTDRLSSLVINHRYVRHAAIGVAGRAQEAGAFAVCWTAAFLWWTGFLPTSVVWCYALVSAVASGINAARTLAAHRYDNDHDELDRCSKSRRTGVNPRSIVLPYGAPGVSAAISSRCARPRLWYGSDGIQ